MRRVQLLTVLAAALTLPACISMTTVIKVKKDGSGTVTQKMVMQPAMAQMMAGMAAMGAEEGAPPPELFPEKELRAKAAKMGPGVELVSSRKIEGAEGTGVEAVYSFKDIRTLQVEQKPTPPMEGVSSKGESEAPQFALTQLPNGNAQLVVNFPEPKGEGGAEAKGEKGEKGEKGGPAEKPNAQQMAQAKQMLKGLRIGLYVDAGQKVVKTTSPYLEGNRVTLMEIDFESLLGDEQKLQQLMATEDQGSMEAAKKILKDFPGVKVNVDRQVTIEYR
jgi:hypothetical protein